MLRTKLSTATGYYPQLLDLKDDEHRPRCAAWNGAAVLRQHPLRAVDPRRGFYVVHSSTIHRPPTRTSVDLQVLVCPTFVGLVGKHQRHCFLSQPSPATQMHRAGVHYMMLQLHYSYTVHGACTMIDTGTGFLRHLKSRCGVIPAP